MSIEERVRLVSPARRPVQAEFDVSKVDDD